MKIELNQPEEAFATFRIAGDKLVPGAITKILGITPTRSHSKGEQYRDGPNGSPVVGRTGVWFVSSDQFLDRHYPLVFHIQLAMALLGVFNQKKLSMVRSRVNEDALHIVLTCYWHGPTGAHTPEIPKDIFDMIELIPAKLEIDFDADQEPPDNEPVFVKA